VAFAPWAWWALGIGLFAGDALLTSMYLLALVASVVVGYQWGQPPERWLTALAWMTALVAGLSAAIGLLQWLDLAEPFTIYVVQANAGDRAMGNLGQPNHLGTLLLMGMAALLLLFEMRRFGVLTFAVCVAFLTLALALTQSRAALLSTFVMAAFLLVKGPYLARLKRLHVLVWALVVPVLMNVAVPLVNGWLLLSAGRSLVELGRTSDRMEIWHQVAAGIAQAPWLGYGWNQTTTAHAFGALDVPGTLIYSYAHNMVLDLMAWTGIPLALLLTGMMAWWSWSRMRKAVSPAAIAALAALLPVAVHSLVEYPNAYAYFLILAGLLIGVVEASHPGARKAPLRRKWAWTLLAPCAVVGAYVCYEYILIEEDFRIVRFENLRIGTTPVEYEVPNVWMISHLAEALHAARVRPAPGMTPLEIERLRKVALRFSWGVIHLRYCYVLALNNDPQGAAREMRRTQAIFGEQVFRGGLQELRRLEQEHPEVGATLKLL
jgi:O-antigen ligase